MVFLSGKNEVSADFSVNFQKSAYIAYDCISGYQRAYLTGGVIGSTSAPLVEVRVKIDHNTRTDDRLMLFLMRIMFTK
jgi:hypothetical protein